MNWNEIATSVAPVMALVLGNAAFIIPLFLWNRYESRSDHRQSLDLILAIQTEMKDFHGRLCAIEARRHDKR